MIKPLRFLAIIVLFWSCQSQKEVSTTYQPKVLNEKETIAFGRYYTDGAKAKILGNLEEAEQLYKQALSIDPTHPAANYELGLIYNQTDRKQLAFQQFAMASKAEPNNYWYKLSYASFLDNAPDKTQAIKVYKELAAMRPNQLELKYQLSKLLLENGKPKESIAYLDQIEGEVGITEDISMLKQQIYLSQNDLEGAVGEVKALIEAFPQEVKYLGQLADLYRSNNKEAKAIEVYQKMEELAPNDYRVQITLAEFHQNKGESEKHLEYLKKAFNNPGMKVDDKVKYILSAYRVNERNQKKKDEGIQLCKIIAETHPEDAKAHAIYADFLYFDGQNEMAQNEYMKTIDLDSSRFPVWNQLLVILSERGEVDHLINYGERATRLFPNQPSVYLLYGLGLAQKENHQDAVDQFKRGSQLIIDNPALKSQVYSSMGDSYHALKEHELSDKYYEKSLEIDSNNVFVLNNYSYYLSLRNEKLERAKQMSYRSNSLSPEQPSFQDTYAWILYQLGEYKEAKVWIDKAVKNSSEKSGVILEHKGDILYKLGNKEEAIEFWKKAKSVGGASDELEEKLKSKGLNE